MFANWRHYSVHLIVSCCLVGAGVSLLVLYKAASSLRIRRGIGKFFILWSRKLSQRKNQLGYYLTLTGATPSKPFRICHMCQTLFLLAASSGSKAVNIREKIIVLGIELNQRNAWRYFTGGCSAIKNVSPKMIRLFHGDLPAVIEVDRIIAEQDRAVNAELQLIAATSYWRILFPRNGITFIRFTSS